MDQLILKLLNPPDSGSPPAEIEQIAKKHGTQFRAMHPGAGDQALESYFWADVSSDPRRDELLQTLRQSSHVDGAYLKPDGETPDTPT